MTGRRGVTGLADKTFVAGTETEKDMKAKTTGNGKLNKQLGGMGRNGEKKQDSKKAAGRVHVIPNKTSNSLFFHAVRRT